MRLRQLARKIDKSPAQIISFLAEKGFTLENDDNAKVEDAHTILVIKEFAPALMNDAVGEIPDEPQMAEPVADSSLPAEPELPVVESAEEQLPELIKAPKIELSGLKVIGKIDLPESRKKEMPVEQGEAQVPKIEKDEFRRRSDQRNPPQRQSRKNPVVLQREKEIREEQQRQEEERQRQKEMRVLHYEKKMHALKSIKPVKKAYQDELQTEAPEQHTLPQPKTVWGKFMRWLNT